MNGQGLIHAIFHGLLNIIGIKHGYSCINIRQVPWEVLKTEAEGRGFQYLPRDLANVNALKTHVRLLLLHKKLKTFATFRVISCTILFCLFTDVSRTQFPRTRAGHYTSRDGSNSDSVTVTFYTDVIGMVTIMVAFALNKSEHSFQAKKRH